jgi:3-oxoacyl-[acyl-carrier protein] reductase
MRFEGRAALVTGAARGIGAATAVKLAREGADVAVHYNQSADGAAAVCAQVAALGRRAMAVQADITNRAAVRAMVEDVTAGFGSIDLLVNNAGESSGAEFEALTAEHWDRIVAVNLTGPFNVIWAVKDGMIARNFGRIVNVSSIAALAVRPYYLPYAAAKAGVISLTKSCCEPLARHNIRINAVAPGAIKTEMLFDAPQAMVDALCAATPLSRLGEPEEMADVIAYLLSEEASYLTGTTVIASGGRLLFP